MCSFSMYEHASAVKNGPYSLPAKSILDVSGVYDSNTLLSSEFKIFIDEMKEKYIGDSTYVKDSIMSFEALVGIPKSVSIPYLTKKGGNIIENIA